MNNNSQILKRTQVQEIIKIDLSDFQAQLTGIKRDHLDLKGILPEAIFLHLIRRIHLSDNCILKRKEERILLQQNCRLHKCITSPQFQTTARGMEIETMAKSKTQAHLTHKAEKR